MPFTSTLVLRMRCSRVRRFSPNILLSTFNCRLLTSPRGAFFASSRPTLPFTSTLVLRMRCSRVRRFLSESPAFDFQLSTINLPAWVFLRFLTPYLAVHDYLSSPHLRFLCVFCIPVVLPGHPGHLYRNPEGACGRRFRELRNRRLRPCGRDSSPNILLSTFNRRLLTSPRGSFFASSRPALPFTSALVLRMRCSRLRRFLSESPAFDFQLSTVNLPARVFLRFLTSYLAVHEYLSSPHAVQPSAQIPLRTFYFRLSTVDC